jgi:vancomycin resistance protein YoaR
MIKHYFLLLFLLLFNIPIAVSAEEIIDAGQIKTIPNSGVTLNIDQHSEIVPLYILEKWILYRDAFSLNQNYQTEFENTDYCPVNKIFCALTFTEIKKKHLKLSPQININEKEISVYLEDLARKINRDSLNAKFKIENEKVVVFSEAQNGLELDIQKSVANISDFLKKSSVIDTTQSIDLSFIIKKPELDYADINNIGISSLIGTGVSNFKGSPANRIHNIKIATERFNGVLIKPGEEFSFVQNLGDVDANHGYLPELVIKKGVTEPEFGGGICQVSTTTFRAAIYSGLEITARRNHAYPVSYYNPQGMDASVYVPQPDLKFKNNTPGYILIQTKIEDTNLIFNFYGTDDGRKIIIDGPKIIEKQPNGSMRTTFTQHVFDSNDQEFITDIFNSSYNSPNDYPHPGQEKITSKPDDWSKKQWNEYKKANNL